MLLEIIADHNQKMNTLVGDDYAEGTLKRYEVLYRHTQTFLKERLDKDDHDIRKIDFSFVSDYEFFLRSVRKMNNNSAVKHMKMLRKILSICLHRKWIELDPFQILREI